METTPIDFSCNSRENFIILTEYAEPGTFSKR